MDNQTPRRSWLRVTVLALAALVVIALAASLLLKVVGRSRLRHASAELQSRFGVTTLAAFDKPAVSADQNAARWLQAGAMLLSDSAKEVAGTASSKPASAWSAEETAALRKVIADSQPALDLLQRAVTLERSNFDIPYREGWNAQLPKLLQLIVAGRLLAADARLAFAENDPARALPALRSLAHLATGLEDEPLLITELIGIACERMLLTVVTEAAESPAPWASDPAVLGQLQALVSSSDLPSDLRRAFAFEAMSSIDALTRNPAELEGGFGSSWRAGFFERHFSALAGAEMARLVLSWAALLDVPYSTAPERFANRPKPPFYALHRLAAYNRAPNLGSSVARVQTVLSLRQLAHAGLELRAAAASAGAYPTTVPALAQPCPLTGAPVTFRREADGSVVLDIPGVAKQLTDAGLILGPLVLTVTLPPPR